MDMAELKKLGGEIKALNLAKDSPERSELLKAYKHQEEIIFNTLNDPE